MLIKKQLEKDLLIGQKIIITGGSSGIGKALAHGFTDLGAKVGLLSRSKDKMEKIVEEINNKGGKAIFEAASVRDFQEVKDAVDSLVKRMGGITSIINNAGVERRTDFIKFRQDQIDLLVDTNIKGVFYSTHAALPYLLEIPYSSIITTSSISSVNPVAKFGIYCASKAAMNMFTESLAIELKKKKIRVNAILPGMVDTPMMRHGMTEEYIKAMNPILPEDLLAFYAYMLSDKAKKLTGKLINIEVFRKVIPLIESFPADIPRNWSGLGEILKEKLHPTEFSNAKSNKKLLEMLIS